MDPAAPLLARLAALVPELRAHAADLDEAARFPGEDIAMLAEAGLLRAVRPAAQGGLGLGTEPHSAAATFEVLRLLGSANLALTRLFEAHVNAARLLVRYGGPTPPEALTGLWVTDPPGGGVRLAQGRLEGGKQFCSGAGHLRYAVVTAECEGGIRLALARLEEGVRTTPLPAGLAGMRAATTGQAEFTGAAATAFGAPGDYLREPDFSCGAWRTSAATVGGLEALVGELGRQLAARGRAGDPHQQARYGQALIEAETARLWMARAADRAEAPEAGAEAIAYVGLARQAVERACLATVALAQRSLGVAALQRGNPVERLCRDLATYLRQPAGDEVLTQAAAHALARL